MTVTELMDIFRLPYAEGFKPSVIAALNREPSNIARELEKGMDSGMYSASP
ncbi:MAG: helix-turn-helix domain-containing protein [Spirochaetaceae bacterium]|jgi:hypothetical protein|nr:helix-turn-helix domain-containing protein [Spirochaetaceae bacterium]